MKLIQLHFPVGMVTIAGFAKQIASLIRSFIPGLDNCSTASYAAKEIKNVPMQDEKTGDFLPQEPGYLSPATHLLSSFGKQ